MLTTYVTGLLATVAVVLFWGAVQGAWKRVFPEGADPDALAGRMGCRGCKCTDVCERRPARGSIPAVEDNR